MKHNRILAGLTAAVLALGAMPAALPAQAAASLPVSEFERQISLVTGKTYHHLDPMGWTQPCGYNHKTAGMVIPFTILWRDDMMQTTDEMRLMVGLYGSGVEVKLKDPANDEDKETYSDIKLAMKEKLADDAHTGIEITSKSGDISMLQIADYSLSDDLPEFVMQYLEAQNLMPLVDFVRYYPYRWAGLPLKELETSLPVNAIPVNGDVSFVGEDKEKPDMDAVAKAVAAISKNCTFDAEKKALLPGNEKAETVMQVISMLYKDFGILPDFALKRDPYDIEDTWTRADQFSYPSVLVYKKGAQSLEQYSAEAIGAMIENQLAAMAAYGPFSYTPVKPEQKNDDGEPLLGYFEWPTYAGLAVRCADFAALEGDTLGGLPIYCNPTDNTKASGGVSVWQYAEYCESVLSCTAPPLVDENGETVDTSDLCFLFIGAGDLRRLQPLTEDPRFEAAGVLRGTLRENAHWGPGEVMLHLEPAEGKEIDMRTLNTPEYGNIRYRWQQGGMIAYQVDSGSTVMTFEEVKALCERLEARDDIALAWMFGSDAGSDYDYARLTLMPIRHIGSGDLNGDGESDIADAVLLARYNAEDDGVKNINLTEADLTGDGRVNAEDHALLLQHLAVTSLL